MSGVFFLLLLLPPWLLHCLSSDCVRSLLVATRHRGRNQEPGRQTDGNGDICQWQQSDGGRKWETVRHGAGIAFSFSPFSFPLADSEELMKEQYDNLLFSYFVLSTALSGLGRSGMVTELSQLQRREKLLLWMSACFCYCCCWLIVNQLLSEVSYSPGEAECFTLWVLPTWIHHVFFFKESKLSKPAGGASVIKCFVVAAV